MPSLAAPRTRARAWLAHWRPVLPILFAEAVIWVGFGAMLPVLPIYFVEHGTDLPTLGLVIAAWPAARLVSEPAFGWLADRLPRRPLMVLGLVVTAIATVLPVWLLGPTAFLALRAAAGLGAALYDPAARGYLVDASPAARQGETFGLYGAAQMGGLVVGPLIGGLAVLLVPEPAVVFWVAAAGLGIAAGVVALRTPDLPSRHRHAPDAVDDAAQEAPAEPAAGPDRLLNRLFVAALVFNVAQFFGAGTYEVVWSLYLVEIGGTIETIGLTFVALGLPILILSPVAGRVVDRRGGGWFLVGGLAVSGLVAPLYPLVPEVWYVLVISVVEGVAFACLTPAVYALVARASPPGRASTAQGLFGAAGTTGTIVASLSAGVAADADIRLPFMLTGAVVVGCLIVGGAIGGPGLRVALRPRPSGAPASTHPSALPESSPFG